MWRVWPLACLVVGCGRWGFGAEQTDVDARANDGSSDAASDGPQTAAPEAWFRFEDSASDGASDSSGRGHTADCPVKCPTVAAGRVGSAYDFSGGAYLRIPDDGRFSDDTAVTLAGWVLCRSTINQAIVSKPHRAIHENSWQFEVEEPGRGCASGPIKECVDSVFTWGAWQHFAITYDGALKRLYVNGTEAMAWSSPLVLDTHDVVLGADYQLDDAGNFVQVVIPLDGLLDEVLIYDRVLAPSEIALLATP